MSCVCLRHSSATSYYIISYLRVALCVLFVCSVCIRIFNAGSFTSKAGALSIRRQAVASFSGTLTRLLSAVAMWCLFAWVWMHGTIVSE